jgi:hypothetical protein
MYKFFQRHEKNKAISPEYKSEPWRDNGYVAWLIWGSDAGKTWAEKLWGQMESADAKAANPREAGVRDVVTRIFKTFGVEKGKDLAERVVNYWKTKNDRDDIGREEQRRLYSPTDNDDTRRLTKKKKLNIDWTSHANYRSDLRDVDPEKVNDAITEKLRNKLIPQKGKKPRLKSQRPEKLIQPGLGTMVVDYDLERNPADADVVTVWASDRDARPVTASEMRPYCEDCARAIAAGELVVTYGELRDTIRTADKWKTKPKGWTNESRKKFWESLTGGVKQKTKKCIKEMTGKVSDPGAFCGSLRDRVEGKSWRHEKRK